MSFQERQRMCTFSISIQTYELSKRDTSYHTVLSFTIRHLWTATLVVFLRLSFVMSKKINKKNVASRTTDSLPEIKIVNISQIPTQQSINSYCILS